mmetsp:Transcript_7724/g.17690  ORF Transcript_7724/g.17690 Transcript_7724/m.17690 type:complete len:86 (-) Transcript_7724:73-330(-)
MAGHRGKEDEGANQRDGPAERLAKGARKDRGAPIEMQACKRDSFVGCGLGWGILLVIAISIYLANSLLAPVGIVEELQTGRSENL